MSVLIKKDKDTNVLHKFHKSCYKQYLLSEFCTVDSGRDQ